MKKLIIFLVLIIAARVRAESITVGVFAPTAPFPSTAARVEIASKLADAVGKAIGQPVSSKVFARASDFAAAVKKGEITYALVDAAYLALSGGSYTIIAEARGDHTGWQIVARGGGAIDALRGKRVVVAGIGGREMDFVLNVLLAGELPRDYFGKIETSPDTASALATVSLGKAEAAAVPVGIELPTGVARVIPTHGVPEPLFVAYGAAGGAAMKAKLADALVAFSGDATLPHFDEVREPLATPIRLLPARFATPVKRGPLAVPAIRLLVGDLVEGRTLSIERTPATAFAIAPGK